MAGRDLNQEAWLVDTRADIVLRRVAISAGRGGDLQQIDGALWVADFAHDRVQRIQLEGSRG